MSRFLTNEANILDKQTIKMLQLGSQTFERKEDRAFIIAGLYAITAESVASVSIFRLCRLSI